MATHGSIDEFRNAQEDWHSYVERLQQYFVANDVKTTDKQRAVLLSCVGGATYQLIRNLLAPDKPTDKSFAEIVEAVQRHHQPKPSEIVQRFQFHSRTRNRGESVSAYVAELRKLSEHCNFGETLNDMLRDRLVCGINDSRVQRRLLSEPQLTFAKALELAQAAEAADRHATELSKATPSPEVHAISTKDFSPKRGGAQRTISCYRCGASNHSADKCRFKNTECHHCGKTGHLAKVCRSKQRGFRSRTKAKKGQTQQTHRVDAADTGEDESSDTPYSEPMFNVSGRELAPPIVVTVDINNAKLEMEVDTGASASIISNQTYTQLWPEPQRPRLQQSTKKLRTYTGEQLKLEGYITVEVSYGSQTQSLPLLVVAGNGPSLLGRDWMMKIRLDWHSLHCVQAATRTVKTGVLGRHQFGVSSDCASWTPFSRGVKGLTPLRGAT